MLPTVVVVGCGVAGLIAAHEAGVNGARVVLVEACKKGGGNSIRASSGLSAARFQDQVEQFRHDSTVSAAVKGRPELLETLVSNSPEALEHLARLGLPLTRKLQLGGHSQARTWAQQEESQSVGQYLYTGLMSAIERDVRDVEFLFDHKLVDLVVNPTNNALEAVVLQKQVSSNEDLANVKITASGSGGAAEDEDTNATIHLDADTVVLATGGFAGSAAALETFAPTGASRLSCFATTNAQCADGEALKAAIRAGCGTIDLDQVQFHPTAFVDPEAADAPSRVLCPEAWRGAGAVLLDPESGRRFVNELDRRDVVAGAISALKESEALLVVPPSVAVGLAGTGPDGFYERRGLVRRVQFYDLPKDFIDEEVPAYDELVWKQQQGLAGVQCPRTGKTVFPSPLGPIRTTREATPVTSFMQEPSYLVARVSPAAHYCMGGVSIDQNARVLSSGDGSVIQGLFAAGEVTGGIHGGNRLGGNSLLDCVVYGRIAGKNAFDYAAAAARSREDVPA